MRIGILADIHANFPALEASIEALRRESVDQIVAIGDLLGYGPHPRQTLHRLEKEGIPCVLGSADTRLAFGLPLGKRQGIGDKTLEWTKDQLGEREIKFLRKLSSRYRLELSSGRLLAFHGTPTDPDERLELDGPFASLMHLLEQHRCRYMIASGQHVAFERNLGRGLIIDPGSVGLTLGGEPGADVLLLTDEANGLHSRFMKVPYDFGEIIFDLQAWELPPVLSEVIKNGRFPKA